jgi:hypothetical protein
MGDAIGNIGDMMGRWSTNDDGRAATWNLEVVPMTLSLAALGLGKPSANLFEVMLSHGWPLEL